MASPTNSAAFAAESLRPRTVDRPGQPGRRSVSFARRLSKRGCPQASWVTLTGSCRCNNSSGDDFARHLRLASLVKLVAGRLESFAHRRDHLGLERAGSYERTN